MAGRRGRRSHDLDIGVNGIKRGERHEGEGDDKRDRRPPFDAH
jgi:hypothetical protein